MEKFHFTQFSFPAKEKTPEITRPQIKLKTRKLSAPLAYKSKSNASSPLSRDSKIKPEDLASFKKTSIFHVEEKFSPKANPSLGFKPLKHRKNMNECLKLYQKMLEKLEKQKEKRLINRRNVKTSHKVNPWRYSLPDSYSIFDVAQLAKKTFASESFNT